MPHVEFGARRVMLAVLLAAVLMVVPSQASAASCIGAPGNEPAGGTYPEVRQFVDQQAWWTREPGQTGTDEGHAHMGVCIPEREQLSGTVPFHVRVMLHDNPGRGNYVSMVFKGVSQELTVQKVSMGSFTCPAPGTCEKWLTFQAPMGSFTDAGLQEIRFRGFFPEPSVNGQVREMRTNLNFQVYVNNGKTVRNVSRQPYLRGKGWYTHALYCESAFLSVPLPDGPVPGMWQPRVQQVQHSTDASLPITSHMVRLDPDFHNGVPGTTVREGSGPLAASTLSVSTSTLTPGVHRLYQKAMCRDDALGSTNHGALVVPFLVGNG
jgi:hypothetical protein